MNHPALLWIKMMTIRTYSRAVNLPASLAGVAFHARLAAKPKPGKRILIHRWGAIGDIICLQPSLAALRADNPEVYLVFATLPEYLPLARMLDGVDVVLDARGSDYYRPLTDRLYDQVFKPLYEDEKPTGLPRVHVIDDFAQKLGVTLYDRQPHLTVPTALREHLQPRVDALRGQGPLIAIQTGPSEPVRTWPEEHWTTLIERRVTEEGFTVLQLGADFHNFSGKSSRARRVPKAIDWVNQLSIAETAAVISLCDGFLGIDSGLLHLAGAVGIPAVGLFGPVTPSKRLAPSTPAVGVHAPEDQVTCLGCHHREPRLHWRKGCPYDIACMQLLTPDMAFDAVMKTFKQTKCK
jgi:ADP-heptose:LPS heptosyltransferase